MYKTLFLLLLISIAYSCSNTKEEHFIEVDKEYFLIDENHKDLFNPDLTNKIIFNTDKVYSRTEDTVLRNYKCKGYTDAVFIKILDMRGSLIQEENKIYLTDNTFENFETKTIWNEIIKCNITKNEIPLGLGERFSRFEVTSITDDIIYFNPKFAINIQ